ncbi:hypothetical protein MTO96_009532 [Rhipicephalus appendiculatus]
MALRIVVGCCIFGAAYCAVDRWAPGQSQDIDVPVKRATPGSPAAATSAYEDKDGKDKKDTNPEDTGVDESCSATQSNGAFTDNHGEESLEPSGTSPWSIALRLWSKTQALLSEHMMDTLVPPDVQSLLQEAWEAVRNVEWASDAIYDKFNKLFTSIFCILVGLNCFYGGHKNNTTEIEPSPAPPMVDAVDIDWKSIFSISEMACPEASRVGARELSKKDAAATVIQRWVRHVFKPWLQRVKSQPGTEELPSANQRWIDEDHGAVMNTTLEDAVPRTDELEPPGNEMVCPEDALH